MNFTFELVLIIAQAVRTVTKLAVETALGELFAAMEGEVDGLDFYYTIDESMPDNYSNHFTGPVSIPEDVTVMRIISYQNGKPIGKLLNIPMSSLKQRAVKVL